jgi:hypothetical protein
MPYAIPQIVVTRFAPDDFDAENEFDFGFRIGGLAGFGMFFGGVEVEHIFQPHADPLFGIRAGIRL